MIFLFLFSLSLPSGGIFVLSQKALREAEFRSSQTLKAEALETLQRIDEEFLNEPPRQTKIIRKYFDFFSDPRNLSRFGELSTSGVKENLFGTIHILDASGKILMENGTIGGEEFTQQILRGFFAKIVQRHLPHRYRPAADEEGKPGGDFLKTIIDSPELGFPMLLENPGKVCHLSLPHLESYFFSDFFRHPAHPAAVFVAVLSGEAPRTQYLAQVFTGKSLDALRPIRVFAVKHEPEQWYGREKRKPRVLREVAQRAIGLQQVVNETVRWEGRLWSVVCLPGKQLRSYCFMAMIPVDLIGKNAGELRNGILLGSGLALLITFLLGFMLADVFLKPIARLETAMIALRENRVDFRLGGFPEDELGDLARAFDHMLESLEELNAGKLVQEQLFPKTPVTFERLRVHGISQPATHLGGDFFDYFPLGDSLMVIIGDVTGHGIPAALVMAIAKAVASKHRFRGSPEKSFFEELDLTMKSCLRGKRLMTFQTVVACAKTGKAKLYNFGHPYPVLLRKNGESNYLELIGRPMGARGRLPLDPLEFDLSPGDRITFYTDGLVESLDTSTQANPWEAFRRFLAEPPRVDFEKYCAETLARHPFVVSGLPRPDDFTLVMLEYQDDS